MCMYAYICMYACKYVCVFLFFGFCQLCNRIIPVIYMNDAIYKIKNVSLLVSFFSVFVVVRFF